MCPCPEDKRKPWPGTWGRGIAVTGRRVVGQELKLAGKECWAARCQRSRLMQQAQKESISKAFKDLLPWYKHETKPESADSLFHFLHVKDSARGRSSQGEEVTKQDSQAVLCEMVPHAPSLECTQNREVSTAARPFRGGLSVWELPGRCADWAQVWPLCERLRFGERVWRYSGLQAAADWD